MGNTDWSKFATLKVVIVFTSLMFLFFAIVFIVGIQSNKNIEFLWMKFTNCSPITTIKHDTIKIIRYDTIVVPKYITNEKRISNTSNNVKADVKSFEQKGGQTAGQIINNY